METKNCQVCGKKFELTDKRKIYCSGACKAEAHRKRHGLEKPPFLSLSGVETKKMPVTRQKEKTIKKINPNYEQKLAEVKKLENEIALLEKDKEAKMKRFNSLLDKHKEQIIGGSIGVTLGGILGIQFGKSTNEKIILGALGAALFGVVGTAIGTSIRNANDEKIIREFEKVKIEIHRLTGEITSKQIQEFASKTELKGIQKYEFIKEIEEYTEYVQVESLKNFINDKVPEPITIGLKKKSDEEHKVMSLKVFKQAKIDSLDVQNKSHEFFEVLGNPAANFRMMIYGENYNGKSTYALKLAEFLSKNFGRVLFNSSEEGLSTSLQNKVKGINSDMLDISFYKSHKELVSYLKKYDTLKPRFIVIDSVNDMAMGIDDLKELISLDSQRGIIYVMQATKGGTFKGENDFAHEADIRIKVVNHNPILEKNRYK